MAQSIANGTKHSITQTSWFFGRRGHACGMRKRLEEHDNAADRIFGDAIKKMTDAFFK